MYKQSRLEKQEANFLDFTVWRAVSAQRVIRPIIFSDTSTPERYRQQILTLFYEHMTDYESRHDVFYGRMHYCSYSHSFNK